MSNSRAIAAVTATLRNLLLQGFNSDPDLPGVDVTTRPPDKARNGITGNQVNVFLYHTTINAAFANMPMPSRVRSNENGHPPLPLNLYYLVTAYGADDEDVQGHLLLGRAMGILHDHASLDREAIRVSLNGAGLTQPTDLHEQLDWVKITPQPISLDEMSKLWTTFQTQYRISAAYHASVVLVESERPTVVPLPVTRRGSEEDYVHTQGDLRPPYPTLIGFTLPEHIGKKADDPRIRTSLIPGDAVILRGYNLQGTITLRFEHTRLDAPIDLPPAMNNHDEEIRFTLPVLPDPPNDWLAGLYNVSAIVSGTPDRTTNAMPVYIAPVMTITAPLDGDGYPTLALVGDTVTVNVNVSPPVMRSQRVTMLVAGAEVRPESLPPGSLVSQMTFLLRVPARPDAYPLRLRVDGVDSLLIDYSQIPPSFKKDQMLKVT